MAGKLIDVWDLDTFDDELLGLLHANAQLVGDYLRAEQELEFERQRSIEARLRVAPFYDEYQDFLRRVDQEIEGSSIRAWHYTRLTDAEVGTMRTGGIELSAMETTRRRLDVLVASGDLSADTATALLAESPLHDREQRRGRPSQFCLTSHPIDVEDGRVMSLLKKWGGEVVHHWLVSKHLKVTVRAIGTPRVLEVRVPINAIRNAYQTSVAVVASFARSLGCVPEGESFDAFVVRALPGDAVLAVHTKGEFGYDRVGKGYPTNYHCPCN